MNKMRSLKVSLYTTIQDRYIQVKYIYLIFSTQQVQTLRAKAWFRQDLAWKNSVHDLLSSVMDLVAVTTSQQLYPTGYPQLTIIKCSKSRNSKHLKQIKYLKLAGKLPEHMPIVQNTRSLFKKELVKFA